MAQVEIRGAFIRVDQTNGFDAKGGVMKYTYRILFIASLFIGCTSNDEADEPETGIPFNSAGPISGSAGLNSFTFGAATAAAQIEEPVPESDWYLYTAPAPDGLGIGTDINRGVEGYSRALEDVSLIEELGLDAYRFNVSWARLEPQRDQINQEAVAHYRELLEALVAKGIKPMVTIHHFSSPKWIDDVTRRETCGMQGQTLRHGPLWMGGIRRAGCG